MRFGKLDKRIARRLDWLESHAPTKAHAQTIQAFRTLMTPGVTFTEEEKALIRARAAQPPKEASDE